MPVTRFVLALLVACSGESRPDAPPVPSEPLLRSCEAILHSSCDGGWALCELSGECGCARGVEIVACHVPRRCTPETPTCREIGCTERDTIECSLADGRCFCVGHVTGMRDECEIGCD